MKVKKLIVNEKKLTAVFLAALFVCIRAAPAAAAQVMSLEECLAVAEENHPSLTGADGRIMSQRGQLAQDAVDDRLIVNGSASASRSDSKNSLRSETSSSFSVGIEASMKVMEYDANRGKYSTDSQRSSLAAAEEDKLTTLRNIRANVKSAYMTLLLNTEIVGHRLESVRAFENYLEQANAFYETGLQPWYNVTQAEVALGNAQLALLEVESSVEIAEVTLFNAMGIDMPAEEYEFAPIDFEVPETMVAEDEILASALEGRSDYKSSELSLMAGQYSLKAAARASSPSVTVSVFGSTGYSGDGIDELESEWDAGIRMNVDIPIVDGGAAKAGVESATGRLISLESSHEELRQSIVLEVRKALAEIAKARESIRISELNVVSAEENRRIAMGRYETGAGDPFEVTDALLSYTEAQLQNRQALYGMQQALVALDRASGR